MMTKLTKLEYIRSSADLAVPICIVRGLDSYMNSCLSAAISTKIELIPHTEDGVYLSHIRRDLPPALDHFEPDMVVYNAGTDILNGDPLGALDITPEVRQRLWGGVVYNAGWGGGGITCTLERLCGRWWTMLAGGREGRGRCFRACGVVPVWCTMLGGRRRGRGGSHQRCAMYNAGWEEGGDHTRGAPALEVVYNAWAIHFSFTFSN
jgi:hypothetical protein